MAAMKTFVTFVLASVFNDETITPQILLFAAGEPASIPGVIPPATLT
jgi:hypothetical protein